jgi:nucleotide-binding universal stress UspA family protein
MGKILVALDGSERFANNVVQVTRQLFGDVKKHLYVGMLIQDIGYRVGLGKYINRPAFADYNPYQEELLSEEEQHKAEVVGNFVKEAKKVGVRYEIVQDEHFTYHELINQSIYADLMILSYQVFFNVNDQFPGENLLNQILKNSRCPVLILPENVPNLENIIFTYDGRESSVFAIRAFSNLFDQAAQDFIVTILTVMPSLDEEIKNERYLMNLVKHHFNNVGLQLLEGTNISQEILNFAHNVENPLVVMGAFGRSSISNLVIPSVARGIILNQSLPLFIAHR